MSVKMHLICHSWFQRFSPWLCLWGACQQTSSHDNGRGADEQALDKNRDQELVML